MPIFYEIMKWGFKHEGDKRCDFQRGIGRQPDNLRQQKYGDKRKCDSQ